jgi:L-2-hydroxyglutarate oxidase LhgO
LTIDLVGRIKFGPDFEWIDLPTQLDVNPKNLEAAKKEISRYIKLDYSALVPDYAGIRPRITRDTLSFHDFIIRHEEGFPGFINLMAIESPGLTSSMAIAEYVDSLL